MKSAGKARSNGLYRHIRTSKEIIRNLLNDYHKYNRTPLILQEISRSVIDKITEKPTKNLSVFCYKKRRPQLSLRPESSANGKTMR